MAAASTREHLRFCNLDGWTELKGARGNGRDHLYFTKELADGSVLRTKVSHGTNGKEYSKSLWRDILREQLGVPEAEFWQVLKERRPAERETVVAADDRELAPAWLVQCLLYTVGLREHEVAALSKTDAEDLWAEWQARPHISDLTSAAQAQAAPSHDYGLAVS
jgi:hypothetical protein